MGTNYHALINTCPHCDRAEDVIHIGKSSGGWTFSFHATESIRSWKEWQEILKRPTTKIRDEYGQILSFEEFRGVVEERSCPGGELWNRAKRFPGDGNFLDPEGHSFSEGEFC